MLPNIGIPEMIVIMAVALIVFGPKKLPEIGKSLGNALREFNRARNDFMESINSEMDRDEPEHTVSSSSTNTETNSALPAPTERQLEFPDPLETDQADALPYGSAFHAAEGDSQPSLRTTEPDGNPATLAATAEPHLAAQGAGDGKDKI